MEEVLSNEEIEKLLQQFEGNSKKESNVKDDGPYDFTKPHSIKKENIEALKIIYNMYSNYLGNYISDLIREPVKGKLVTIEPIRLDELERWVPSNSTLASFNSIPLNGEFLIYVPDVFLGQIVELICGADITEIARYTQDKIFTEVVFTDLELSVIEDLMDNMIQQMIPCWKKILSMETKLNYVQSHRENSRVVDEGMYYLLVTIMIDCYEIKGEVYMCIPYEALESITDKLEVDKKNLKLAEDDKNRYIEDMNDTIESVKVNLQVNLGDVSMTVKDFLQLETGDVIQLNKHINTPIDMYVEEKLKYKVISGKQNGNMAVKVVDICEKEVF
ncbi:flagellar motor switch protein FliM [Clostridium sediminicola]|uniref:flagellar motor switch protein FliM n=1 Tax=Clostridium sediminicola TaxID=3114879 RepID=UPI0031F26A49